jgi:hypothetical protein
VESLRFAEDDDDPLRFLKLRNRRLKLVMSSGALPSATEASTLGLRPQRSISSPDRKWLGGPACADRGDARRTPASAAHRLLPVQTAWLSTGRAALTVSAGRQVVVEQPDVGGHEILPVGGHVAARWRPAELPTGGDWFCPR